jgi:predicted secreted protein
MLLTSVWGVLLVASLALCLSHGQVMADCANPVLNPAEPVRLRVGEQVAVGLESNPSTGFSWAITSEPDAGVVSVRPRQHVPSASGRLGAAGVDCFVLDAVGPGMTSMDFGYARPFEAGVPASETATVTVVVMGSTARVPVQLPVGP